ncbi:MAG: diguanylate cyclase [Pseudomonadota bacterium]
MGCSTRRPDRLAMQLTECNGIEVHYITKAEEAQTACAVSPGTMVLIRPDCTEAAAEGLQLISRLRADAATRYTPVMTVVRPRDAHIALRALDIGASDFVFDSVDVDELHARLLAHHRRFSLSEQLRADLTSGLEMAVTDPLTRLYNRRYAAAHIPRLMAASHEAGQAFSVMMMDIDKFKQVNDTYGHAVGDAVLVEAAHRLANAVRAIDLVVRFGGEEFLVALPDTTQKEAARIAERLRQEIASEPMRVVTPHGEILSLDVTVSVGLAEVSSDRQESFDTAFSQADHAMYCAKESGRNCVSLFEAAA